MDLSPVCWHGAFMLWYSCCGSEAWARLFRMAPGHRSQAPQYTVLVLTRLKFLNIKATQTSGLSLTWPVSCVTGRHGAR